MEYPFEEILGATFLFYEAQRSGAISTAPGGNRVAWRADQLLRDGADAGLDFSGGSYEAGSAPPLPHALDHSPHNFTYRRAANHCSSST